MEYDSPYGNKYADLLFNVSNFNIIESTLREGEQFANAFFKTETKIKIAKVIFFFFCNKNFKIKKEMEHQRKKYILLSKTID